MPNSRKCRIMMSVIIESVHGHYKKVQNHDDDYYTGEKRERTWTTQESAES